MNNFSYLLRSVSFPLTLKVLMAVLGLAFNYLATQYLPSSEFGLFSLSLLIVLFLATSSKFGLDTLITRISAVEKETSRQTYIEVLIIISVISLILSISLMIFGKWFFSEILNQPNMKSLIPYIIGLIFPNVFLAVNAGLLRGFEYASLSIIFSGLLTLIISIILLINFSPSSALQLIELTFYSNCISCLISFLLCFNLFKQRRKIIPRFKNFSILLKAGVSLWVVALVAILIQQFNIIILARFAHASEIGIYAVAAKISITLSFFLIAINAVFSPKFAKLYKNNDIATLNSLFKNIQKLLIIFAFLISGFIYFLAEPMMNLFGQEYTRGFIWLQILIIGQFFNLATGTSVSLLIMSGNEALHKNNTLLIALITIALSFTLIPKFHALGAAITTSIAMVCQNLLSYYWVNKTVFTQDNIG